MKSHALFIIIAFWVCFLAENRPTRTEAGCLKGEAAGFDPNADRSPTALALSRDGTRILSANQGSGTVSWIDVPAGRVLGEIASGDRPAGVALSKDRRRGVVAHWYGYDLGILDLTDDRPRLVGKVEVGPEPRGVALRADGSTAYVAVGVSNEVVRVDCDSRKVTGRLTVGREPRGIALTPDESRLLVGNARGKSLSVVSLKDWSVERTLPIDGDNLRQVVVSADGRTGYVADLTNRGFAITNNNIDIGWVLGQRVSKVTLDGSKPFETLTLDPQGLATGDAYGTALSSDGTFLAVSCGGSHEVLIFRTGPKELPWRANGSRDLMALELLRDDGRFRRVAVGGRPLELAFDLNGRTLFVANSLRNAIQRIDVETGKLVQTIDLGGPKTPSLEREGEAIFHDATRSFHQWYSCSTCHTDGHTSGLTFDTLNDGWQDFSTAHLLSHKKVPGLRGVTKTGPWTWHGWRKDLNELIGDSFVKTMRGERPSAKEIEAVAAYLKSLEYPRNPYRSPSGELSDAAKRGRRVFRSEKAACASCHRAPEWTDGKIHIIGLEIPEDRYRGYNPPSLRGVYDKDPYLHDGRSKTLRDALGGPHSPENVSGTEKLTDRELDDLIEYLKTL